METAIYWGLGIVAGLGAYVRFGRFIGQRIRAMNPPPEFECVDCHRVFEEENTKELPGSAHARICHMCAVYRDRPDLRERDLIDDHQVARMAERFRPQEPSPGWMDGFMEEYQEITDTPAHEHEWIEHQQFGQPACLHRICACGASERRQSELHRWTLDMPRPIRDAASLPHQTVHEEIAALSDEAFKNRNRVQPGASPRKRRQINVEDGG